MDAKRWSLFGAFAAGCFSSAVFIGWDWGESRRIETSRGHESNETAPPGISARVQRRVAAEHGDDAALSGPATHSTTAEDVAAAREELGSNADAGHESGKSVADVLAHLEAEYRRNGTPTNAAERAANPVASGSASESAPTVAAAPVAEVKAIARADSGDATAKGKTEPVPAPTPSVTQASTSPAVTVPKQTAANEERAPSALSPVLAQQVSSPVSEEAVPTAAPPGLDASVARADSQPSANQLPQVAALQQVALLQQAALAQQMALTQQVVMLQYLQLVSQGSNPRLGAAAPVPRRAAGGRIVDTLPSTFSATDNPWGFTYPPLVVR